MNLHELINKAIQAARDHRAEAERLMGTGLSILDEAVASEIAAGDKAIEEANSYKRMLAAQEAERELSRAGEQPDPETPRSPIGYNRNSDRTATPEYAAAFDAYLNGGGMNALNETERMALVIASDPDGGYTVPADRRPDLLRQMPALSPLLGLVQNIPTSRNEIEWVRVQPNANSPDIFTSAFVGSMVGETAGGGRGAPKFGKVSISLKKARAEAKFSLDVSDDSELDMNAFLNEDGILNLSLLREQQILVGNGVGNNLNGVMNDPSIDATTDVSGSTSDQISNTTSNQGSAPKLIQLLYAVPGQYRRLPSFRFVYNSDTEMRIRTLVDANGNFMWVPGFAGAPDTLLGKGTVISEFMASGGNDGNKVILAGPLSEIAAPIRTNVSAQVLVERYADEDYRALILRTRFGVMVKNPRAFRIGKV